MSNEITPLKKNHNAIVSYIKSDQIMGRFAEILGEKRAKPYVSSVLIAVGSSEKLMACTPQSVAVSAMRAATLQLSCDPATKQAHIVPYKNQAQFIIGYKGIYDLAIRTGRYKHINDSLVYEGEIVTENRITGMHEISGMPTSKEVIGYFLYFEMLSGFIHTFYMTRDDMMAHAIQYSPSWNARENKFWPGSAWADEFDKMGLKTVIRLGLGKYGYFDPYDQAIMVMEPSEENAVALREAEQELPAIDEVTQSEPSEEELIQGLGFAPDDAIEGNFTTEPHDIEWAMQQCLPDGRAVGFLTLVQLEMEVPHFPEYTDELVQAIVMVTEHKANRGE